MYSFNEPSTWGSLGVIILGGIYFLRDDFTAFGLNSGEYAVILTITAIICGFIGVYQRSRGQRLEPKMRNVQNQLEKVTETVLEVAPQASKESGLQSFYKNGDINGK